MDNGSGSTTYTDVKGHTITANGNAAQSIATVKFGPSSGFFDGTGDYLTTPDSSDWNFPGAFTVECWLYILGFSGSGHGPMLIDRATTGYAWFIGSNKSIQWNRSNAIAEMTSGINQVVAGQWYHLATTWDGSTTYRMFKDGNQIASATSSTAPSTAAETLRIGNWRSGSAYDTNGYIDDFRITKGVARYTANFTPPTAAFPDY